MSAIVISGEGQMPGGGKCRVTGLEVWDWDVRSIDGWIWAMHCGTAPRLTPATNYCLLAVSGVQRASSRYQLPPSVHSSPLCVRDRRFRSSSELIISSVFLSFSERRSIEADSTTPVVPCTTAGTRPAGRTQRSEGPSERRKSPAGHRSMQLQRIRGNTARRATFAAIRFATGRLNIIVTEDRRKLFI